VDVSAYLSADASMDLLDLTAGDLLRKASSEGPTRTALVEVSPPGGAGIVDGVSPGPRMWTYADLLEEAEQTAQWLLSKFQPGEHICVWGPNIAEWVILQYGAGLAGLVLVTANPALRSSELDYVLDQSRSVGLVYAAVFRGTDMAGIVKNIQPRLSRLRETVSFADWNPEVRGYDGLVRGLPSVSPTDPAQLQYTSGTPASRRVRSSTTEA
jgi:acyl-CoA synthetase (AMP-forming)/AMP-acid ligase II